VKQEEIQDRIWALMAAVASEGHTDVDVLLQDLSTDDLSTVVHGLATLALSAITPSGIDPSTPEARARLADGLRAELLRRQATRGGPGEGTVPS